MHKYANPAKFNELADKILPWAIFLTVSCFLAGLYLIFFEAPDDGEQGVRARIMYVHVPAAYAASATYFSLAVASFVALVWRHPLALIAGRAAAPIGAMFTVLALATGALWGKPTWGTYWEWDGRMTSVLILLFFYIGYMALWRAMEDHEKAGRASSILALVGVVNLPIIKFSVDWWNSLHQPASIFRVDGPKIAPELLTPLFVMLVAYQLYFVVVLLWRMKLEIGARKIEMMRQVAMSEGRRV
ncbi:MAG: heme transporter HemC [Kordiimonadales bacterium]|nr:MAG: heme transporter HemC [Kordiimonadales bacterium]